MIKNKSHLNMLSQSSKIPLSDYQEELDKAIHSSGAKFERRRLPISPYPYIVSVEQYKEVQEKLKLLYDIIHKIVKKYRHSTKIQSFLNLPKKFEMLINASPSYNPEIMLCRFDFSLVNGKIKIYEINSACPAGLQIIKKIYSAYEKVGIIDRVDVFYKQKTKAFPANKENLFTRLMEEGISKMEYKNTKDKIHIALLNSKYNTLTNELEDFKYELLTKGYKCKIGYIEDITYNQHGTFLNGEKIDVCFHKFDNFVHTDDFETGITKHKNDISAYLTALIEKKVVGINPFSSMFIGESKSILALLKSEEFSYLFSDDEINLIDELIPFTEKLDKNNRGKFLKAKNQFVLKRSLDTRGRSVIIGNLCTQEEWERHIDDAIIDKADYVMQEYIQPESNVYNGDVYFSTQALLMVVGLPVGMFCRTSQDIVTNIGKTGFMQPVLLL